MKLSIIVPVLDEEDAVHECLQNLRSIGDRGHEIIVVDGGSVDETVSIARRSADRVLQSKPGRAVQMNHGARAAQGDLLLFLHVDTLLPDDIIPVLNRLMDSHGSDVWGRFDMRLDGEHRMFRVIETMMNLRSRLTSVATGDQAIFVSRSLFESIGGFPEIALMEDVAISKRLRKRVRPVNLARTVTSSARRWQSRGIWRTIWLMWKLRLYFFLGVPPDRLASMYR